VPAAPRRIKTIYTNPRKGTKARAAVNLMLRREGATAAEIAERVGYNRVNSISAMCEALRNDKGFDIAAFPVAGSGHVGRPPSVYKIIGRYRCNGSYRSFVSIGEQHSDHENIRTRNRASGRRANVRHLHSGPRI